MPRNERRSWSLGVDEHEACREEMRRIDKEWSERYHNSLAVLRVLVEEGDQHGGWIRVANIRNVQYTPEGLIITVS